MQISRTSQGWGPKHRTDGTFIKDQPFNEGQFLRIFTKYNQGLIAAYVPTDQSDIFRLGFDYVFEQVLD